jgi:hypothetical protein
MAAPFVQGQLLERPVTTSIDTTCAHCGRSFRVTVHGGLQATINEATAKPLIFEPQVDWQTFRDPNIIHGY